MLFRSDTQLVVERVVPDLQKFIGREGQREREIEREKERERERERERDERER